MTRRIRTLAFLVIVITALVGWTGCTSADGTVTTYVGVSHGWGYGGYGPGWGFGGWGYPGYGGGVVIGPPMAVPY
jgi:hypothetical protein